MMTFATLTASDAASPSKVEIHRNADGTFTLLRNGQPFFIKGAGGRGPLDLLAECGGNSIRTWSTDPLAKQVDGKPFLDRCQELGLAVTVGLWVKHERHGADYRDQKFVQKQRETIREAVRKYKDHPAILMWGLGNEMEGPTSDGADPTIWKELNELAAIIKEEDRNHPVMTVTAGAVPTKIKNVLKYCPNIDVLGVNVYAAAPGSPDVLRDAKWDKPYVLTEFGPVGHWEIRKTDWEAPVEPTSREKADTYYQTYNTVLEKGRGQYIGSYAFIWGSKQETTFTWFGMFLPTGEKLPTVDAMTKAWTGHWPKNRCPRIESFETDLREAKVEPGSDAVATVQATDKEGNPLTYEWAVISESSDRKEGGDFENTPPSHPECVVKAEGGKVTLKAPTKPGAYRLFVTVRDGKGGAAADNVPFLISDKLKGKM